jgi:aspartate-semialdehyde dehydrogenase
VGATGLAGQQFLAALGTHPRLEVTAVAASSRTAGKAYRDALRHASGQVGWYAAGQLDERIAGLVVQDAESFDARTVDLVFTAIDAGPARELEPRYAQHTPVISTASAFRREADVPLIVPGVNLAHAALLDVQRQRRGWKGFVAPNPNCTTVGLAVTLAPLAQRFGVEHVDMVSLQAVSGAGRSPGVIALDVVDNVIPFIPSEEEKVQWETQKILGTLRDDGIAPAQFGISATCTRIAVLEGHTEVVHVRLAQPADEAGIRAAWASLGADIAGKYPSAPREFITVHDDPFRPQVRLDRDAGDGMVTSVGRLRRDETVDNGWKYVLVSHNTKMGAARGCILLAEYLIERGYIA